MGTEGDTDRGRLFGFETQHIFPLAIGTEDSDPARAARTLLTSIGFNLEGKDNKIEALIDITGLAIWASVSEEVDARIREQVKAGVFPVRLRPEDWTSGSINWLLDVIAPDRKTTGRVLANFGRVVKGGELRLHPVVAGLVDSEMRTKMMDVQRKSPTQEDI